MNLQEFRKSQWFWIMISAATLLGVAAIDLVTGYEIQFFVFYFLPIAIAALRGNTTSAYSMAIASAFSWFMMDFYSHHPYSSEWIRIWNMVIRLVAFTAFAGVLDYLRITLQKLRILNRDLEHALSQVKLLQGMLPICASCKKIRNEAGSWEKLESYIGGHSEAEFTHGLCPDCARKLYPNLVDDIINKT
jgi:hypothetical protein